jgi:hypothetical protein
MSDRDRSGAVYFARAPDSDIGLKFADLPMDRKLIAAGYYAPKYHQLVRAARQIASTTSRYENIGIGTARGLR